MKHSWDVSVPEATAIQKEMRQLVRLEPLSRRPRTVAGADISYNRFSDRFFACVAVFSYPELVLVDEAYADMRVRFPYVSGYLSFREVPAIAKAYERLSAKPDVLMVDGNGIAHPRRMGAASHLGIVLDIPTIGCAKTRLFGQGKQPAAQKGSVTYLRDPKEGDIVGAYVRTRRACAPVVISPGHRITLQESVDIALSCALRHRIPEPTRRAHMLVNAYRAMTLSGE